MTKVNSESPLRVGFGSADLPTLLPDPWRPWRLGGSPFTAGRARSAVRQTDSQAQEPAPGTPGVAGPQAK